MLFHTSVFWFFFFAVVVAFYTLPRRARTPLLLVASYVFYMAWDWRFAGLILMSTAIDYGVGRAMNDRTPRGRRGLLVLSLVVNLGILGFYKYFDFFVESFAGLFGLDPASATLGLVLPVGVSFYTFQSMSYTIDVYRGRLQPVRSAVDFALFVAFFPQLVAGPIVRAATFFPQLRAWSAPDGLRLREAIQLILFGLVKKMVLADRFAMIADPHFADPGTDPVAAWVGVFAFAMQIFFDFSGYTDIARGCALVLGFDFPVNFRRPYLATSITDFWHRWHISLSNWLRDYLYVPLGGNRHGTWKTYRNLMLTMLLGGLWHGAAWTFVVWGAWHGALLAIERALGHATRGSVLARLVDTPGLRPLRVLWTFVLVCAGWVVFRAPDLATARSLFEGLFAVDQFVEWKAFTEVAPALWWGTALTLVVAWLEDRYGLLSRLPRQSSVVQVMLYVVCLWLLEFFAVVDQSIPYVYFQF